MSLTINKIVMYFFFPLSLRICQSLYMLRPDIDIIQGHQIYYHYF